MKILASILLVLCAVTACSPGDVTKAIPAVSESQVLSTFKMVETFQGVRMTERDGFARTLAALKEEGYSSRQLDGVVSAQSQGNSLNGYIFTDIVADERGGALNNDIRYGLTAVPEKAGAGTSWMLLIDLGKLQINEESGTSNGIGGELYKTTSAVSPGASWPSSADLAVWEKITRRSPKEALDAAKEVKRQYDDSRR
jgi:hypothetical protein